MGSEWVNQFRYRAGPLIPATLGKFPYWALLQLLRAKLKRGPKHAEVWARHSYALGTLVPFVSDLDITVFFPYDPGHEELQSLRSTLSEFKRFFPHLGEANVYSRTDLPILTQQMNYQELRRDPRLLERLAPIEISRRDGDAETFVFLIRMLDADRVNLLQRPGLRLKKWRAHLKAASAGESLIREMRADTLISTVCEFAASLIRWESAKNVPQEIEEFIRVPLDHRLLSRHPLWAGLFPHRFSRASMEIPDADLLRVFSSQLAWEIFGITSQYRIHPDPLNLVKHLESLIRLPATARFPSICAALQKLSSSCAARTERI